MEFRLERKNRKMQIATKFVWHDSVHGNFDFYEKNLKMKIPNGNFMVVIVRSWSIPWNLRCVT